MIAGQAVQVEVAFRVAAAATPIPTPIVILKQILHPFLLVPQTGGVVTVDMALAREKA
jgi:hypothetical protein